MIDRYGRTIDYLRISVTDLCNLRCTYCMPPSGVAKKARSEIMSLEQIERIAQAAVKLGFKKIRLTGGEPLVRKEITELIREIAELKPGGLREIGLTTNGTLLQDYADRLKQAGLTRVNISLDSMEPDKYRAISRGGEVKRVFEGIRAAREAGLTPLKLNVVLVGGFNEDEIENFVELTRAQDLEVRFIELMPIGEAARWASGHFITGNEVLRKVPQLIELPRKGRGGVARLYKLPGSKGQVGIISPLSNHFCRYCNRIRITADGRLKPCLHSDLELNSREYGAGQMERFLTDGIRAKPIRHHILNDGYSPVLRNMNEIGG